MDVIQVRAVLDVVAVGWLSGLFLFRRSADRVRSFSVLTAFYHPIALYKFGIGMPYK